MFNCNGVSLKSRHQNPKIPSLFFLIQWTQAHCWASNRIFTRHFRYQKL